MPCCAFQKTVLDLLWATKTFVDYRELGERYSLLVSTFVAGVGPELLCASAKNPTMSSNLVPVTHSDESKEAVPWVASWRVVTVFMLL